MTYTYDRSKTAGYDGWDPPESGADYLEPNWDSNDVENEVEAAVKDDLLRYAVPNVEKVSGGKMRLKVKRVTANEGKVKLEEYKQRGSYRSGYDVDFEWSAEYKIEIQLEITGVAGKKMTPREVYDLIYDRDYGDMTLETNDGMSFDPLYEPDDDEVKVGYYGDKLKVNISSRARGYLKGGWADEPPEPDYDY